MTFSESIENCPLVLSNCSTYQRMIDDYHFPLHPVLGNSTWIYDDGLRETLAQVNRQYFAVAQEYGLPMMATAPSYRGGREEFRRAGLPASADPVRDNVAFVRDIARDYTVPIFVGGIEGCKGSQYDPVGAGFSAEDAYQYHIRRMQALSDAAPDYLYSGIMPAVAETIGMARAFSETGLPYYIAFVMTDSGCILDGTPLGEAIERVKDAVPRQPVLFMANCIHPTNLLHALQQPVNQNDTVRRELRGSISNASMLKPCELECCAHVDNDDAETLAGAMLALAQYHPMKVHGGCCGTNDTHMRAIARRMKAFYCGS